MVWTFIKLFYNLNHAIDVLRTLLFHSRSKNAFITMTMNSMGLLLFGWLVFMCCRLPHEHTIIKFDMLFVMFQSLLFTRGIFVQLFYIWNLLLRPELFKYMNSQINVNIPFKFIHTPTLQFHRSYMFINKLVIIFHIFE